MTPFISDQPFTVEFDNHDPTIRRVEIRLRAAITEPNRSLSDPSASIEFVLDTGADYAEVFPQHLNAFGIDPETGPSGGWVDVRLLNGQKTAARMRGAKLWLFGDSSDGETHPYPIELSRGLVVIPKLDDSIDLLPVLGMNPLIDAGLRIELDAERQKFSAWIPLKPH